MRQIGFLRDPTLLRRIRTAMRPERLPTAQQLLRAGHLALGELLHQPAHLTELLSELIYRLHGRARALRDPLAARAVDDVGTGSFRGRHREDDRLDPVEFALVEVDVAKLLHRSTHP